MANTLITPAAIARASLASLYETTAMLPLVYTDVTSDFGTQKVGNTINVRKPAVFTASTFDRAVGIVPQNAVESQVPVVLNTIKDVSFIVTSEELTLTIDDFTSRFLDPAMEALAQSVDVALMALRSDITQVVGSASGLEYTKPEVLIDAGRILNINKVPALDRYAVVGPSINAAWLNNDVLKHYDKSGSTDALRAGSIGANLFGFDAYWSQNVGQPAASPTTGQPTTERGLAFHKTAFAFASAPLEVAPGSNAAVQSYKGLNIRVAYDYDIKYKQTVVSCDILFGAKTLDASRAVIIRGPLQP